MDRRREREAGGLDELGLTLAACIKQNDAFHVVLTALRHAGARMGAVCMPDPAVDSLVVRLSFAMAGASNKLLRRSTPRRETAAERAFASRAAVEVDYGISSLTPTDLEEKLGIDRALMVPIPGGDAAAGLLLLVPPSEDETGGFRPLAERMAALLAEHMAHLAPQPVVPTRLPTGSAAGTDTFMEALKDCAETSDIERLSEKVLDHCLAFTRSRFGFVGYVDPETGFLFTPTMTRDIFHQCQVAGKTVVFEKPGGLGGVVFDGDQPLIANDPAGHPSSVGTPPGHLPIRRFMGVPCMHQGRKRGMIGLANKEGDYTDNDLELVEVFAALYGGTVARWFAEAELADERRRFAQLFDSAPCGFVVTDANGHIREINATLLGRLGLTRDDALGRDLGDLLDSTSLGAYEMQLAAAKDSRTTPMELLYKTATALLRVRQSVRADADERGFVRRYQVTVEF